MPLSCSLIVSISSRTDLSSFSDRLGYQFKNPALLEQALRHRSAGKPNNERLEFLGDAILGFLVSEMLYQRHPTATEGELSRLRARLVQRGSLATIARELHLGDYLDLGLGELKSGGAERESILADAVEALLSALYLDAGLDQCRVQLDAWFAKRLLEGEPSSVIKDPKTRLQEWLQARKRSLPVYRVTSTTGSGHQQYFTVECRVDILPEGCSAGGNSRKEAEQAAARQILIKLGVDRG